MSLFWHIAVPVILDVSCSDVRCNENGVWSPKIVGECVGKTLRHFKTHGHFDHQGHRRAEEAVLLRIPRILSMGLWRFGGAHLFSKCV